jgi:MFS family permease
MSTSFSEEIERTQQQYLRIVTGAYFTTGFFWVFMSLGSVKIEGKSEAKDFSTFLYSMIVLMVSNAVWEILTGWYADKFRRRTSIYLGFFISGVGFLLMGAAAFFDLPGNGAEWGARLPVWLVGVACWSLGPALRSGAQEAWLVDRCNFLSEAPPEPLSDIFKRAARQGVMAKAAGAILCFFILFPFVDRSEYLWFELSFSLAGGLAALLTGFLGYYSLRLQEEYWTDPKYQSEESLFAFLWVGVKELCRVPYLWFTLAFIGATVLNYLLSSTIWAYLGHDETGKIKVLGEPRDVMWLAIGIIAIELVAGYLSKPFSRQIDRIEQPRWRMPAAALIHLLPILPLYIFYPFNNTPDGFIYVLIAAALFFRIAHASVFGTLNAQGQLLIDSDERRAVMISMSSAIAAILMALAFYLIKNKGPFDNFEKGIEFSWVWITPLSVLMLAVGGYLVARGGRD